MNMSNLSKFNYQGSEITFQIGNGEVMVNATEMAKSFNKEVKQWFDNRSTHEFIHALADHKGYITKVINRTSLNTSELAIVYPELIAVIKGGIPGQVEQGTWMHEDVALEFARWLSPTFAIWCNDHIKQMLRTGQTSIGSLSDDQKILDALQILQQRVETTTKQLQIANSTIIYQTPKVDYYNEVLDSKGLISTTIIAKDLGMSAESLNRKLNQMGIIFRQANTWVPYAKYQGNGFCKSKTFPYTDQDGKQKTSIHFYWTEKGREFLYKILDHELVRA